ncbi:P-loop containing nucleoside triphosphate hydrolase protein [Bisporella sp. PMI_857]|nr:P-loop containing nucleoside triphosphate hydrolase protein [Bisporella sp. PMI_857]
MAHANMERWEIFLPCHFLPFDHNPGFYGWQSILERTRDALADKDADKRIKLVVFWGTGGIGKSQIALEYASQQGSEGVPIIIWISSEKETEVASSFNKVAQKMKLPGVLPSNTPDRNRDLVLEYLQRTEETKLQPIWPTAGHSNIIVTCRSKFQVGLLVNKLIEVPTFTAQEGGDFILKRLGQRVTTGEDIKYSQRLSERLGGLALALEIAGKQIKHRKKSVEQFLPFYNRNRQILNKEPTRGSKNPYCDRDLDSVWEQLDPRSF